MSGGLTICKLSARLVMPQGRPDAMALRADLRRDLTERLPGALGRAAQERLGTGPGCAVVGKLAVDVSLVPGESAEAAATRWATAILDRLEANLRTGGRIYADRTEHLAVFIDAAADGRRDGRAALRPWAGLGAMPAALAIRAALCAPDAPARAALLRLPSARRLAILNRLPPEEARPVLAALARRGLVTMDLSETALTIAARRAVNAPVAAILLSLGPAASAGPSVAPATAEQFAAEVMRSLAPERAASGRRDDALDPHSGTDRSDLPEPLRAVVAEPRARKGTTQATDPMRSPFAGLVVLLPDLITLLSDAALARYARAARLRYDVLRAAFGDPFGEDALLRCLAGVPPEGRLPPESPEFAVPGAVLAEPERDEDTDPTAPDAPVTPEHIAGLLLRRFASRLRGFETVSDGFLRDNLLPSCGRGAWRDGRLSLRFTPPPLGVVLVLAGCDSGRLRLPWLPGVRVDFASDAGR